MTQCLRILSGNNNNNNNHKLEIIISAFRFIYEGHFYSGWDQDTYLHPHSMAVASQLGSEKQFHQKGIVCVLFCRNLYKQNVSSMFYTMTNSYSQTDAGHVFSKINEKCQQMGNWREGRTDISWSSTPPSWKPQNLCEFLQQGRGACQGCGCGSVQLTAA